jgi:hypothetical protein
LTLAKLDPKASSLPTEDELRKLSELSKTEIEELARLEAELAADPIALAATRRRAVACVRSAGWPSRLRIPTYPAGRSDKIRSVIPGYPAT